MALGPSKASLFKRFLMHFLKILILKKLRPKAQVAITSMKLGSTNTYKNPTPLKISKERYWNSPH